MFGVINICLVMSSNCQNRLPFKDQSNLEEGFLSPPENAKPRVWWHWMNGNIAKEGIKS